MQILRLKFKCALVIKTDIMCLNNYCEYRRIVMCRDEEEKNVPMTDACARKVVTIKKIQMVSENY